jgi:UDPglucose 6-dehydrogenase
MARKTKSRVAEIKKSRIAVIGLGFVGLTTALGFARKGFIVRGFDAAERITKSLRAGKLLFHEPHLPEQLHALFGKKFFICDSLLETVADADVIFYCVGTPQSQRGAADVSYLQRAISDTLKALPRGRKPVLVIKSTVPPGTTAREIVPLFAKAGRTIGRDIGLANNPEFLREGVAWEDFIGPDRVVIGAADDLSFAPVAELYKPFHTPVCRVSRTGAEFIKSVSNALLASLVSFSNEASMIADAIGDIDVKSAFQVLHLDRRWTGAPGKMASYLFPGCGFGGYCLPKDIAALKFAAHKAGARMYWARSWRRTTRLRPILSKKSCGRRNRRRASASWVCPSSPAVMTCAKRPRHVSSNCCSKRAAKTSWHSTRCLTNPTRATTTIRFDTRGV